MNKNGKCVDPVQEWNFKRYGIPMSWALDAPPSNATNELANIHAGIQEWLASTNHGFMSPRINVFVHGGLNAYATSLARLRDSNLMSGLEASNCYPIFIVWNSGMISSYAQHLLSIRQGEEHHIIARFTSPFVLISDLAVGVARLPQTYVGRIYNDFRATELTRDSQEEHFADDIYGGWAKHTHWEGLYDFQDPTAKWEGFEMMIHSMETNYHNPLPEGGKRGHPDRITHYAEYIVTTPTKIVTLPIIDGLGTEAWAVMQRRTQTMFNRPTTYDIYDKLTKWHTDVPTNPVNFNSVSNWLNSGKSGAMYAFAGSVVDWQNPTNGLRTGAGQPVPFDFCGHSMGTMVLNELFRRNPEIQASNIVYLAAACSVRDFEISMFPYLVTNPGTQFYNISLHRMRERDEYCLGELEGSPSFGWLSHVYFVRDLTVRGSLLNWIDDIFQKPNTIPERTMGAWENITRTLPDIPIGLRPQIHLRGCDVEPLNAFDPFGKLGRLNGEFEPQNHGDFTRSVYWSPAFYWPDGTNSLPLRDE